MAETKCGFNDAGDKPGSSLLVMYGPTLMVNIGFDPKYKAGIVPIAGIKGVRALVDTGATECCIDNLLASQLRLPIVDRRAISGVHGSQLTNMYLAQVHIPTLNSTVHGAFAGVDLRAGGQMHSALIGRTFLQNFKMTYEGKTGTVIISSD